MSQWDCYSSRNPGQKGRKYRKIARMVEKMERARKAAEWARKEVKWMRVAREREAEIIQIQQEREREYHDLRKPPLLAVLAALAVLSIDPMHSPF